PYCQCCCRVLFFFSSRRRHTRFSRDWSSDVCSSDLGVLGLLSPPALNGRVLNGGDDDLVDDDAEHRAEHHREHTKDSREGDGEEIGRASCREREWIAMAGGTMRDNELRKDNTRRNKR